VEAAGADSEPDVQHYPSVTSLDAVSCSEVLETSADNRQRSGTVRFEAGGNLVVSVPRFCRNGSAGASEAYQHNRRPYPDLQEKELQTLLERRYDLPG